MKKKLLALILIVIMLASLLTGCSLFTLDENRQFHQVVGTVNYKGMSTDIYRGDIVSLVISYSSYIEQGWTVERLLEYVYGQSTKQKLVTLYAKEYVAKNGLGISAVTDNDEIAKMANKDFLTVDELRYCIEMTNKDFVSIWKENISDLEKTAIDNSADEEETKEDEDLLAARETKPEDSDDTSYVDKGMTDISNLPKYFEQNVSDMIKAETDSVKKSNMRKALKDILSDLEGAYKDYNYYLNQKIETRIIEKYQEAIGETIEISQDEIDKSVSNLVKIDMNTYLKKADYESAASSGTFSTYNYSKDYSQVKSLLVKFSDKQSSVLDYIKKVEGEDVAKTYREKIAFGTLEETDIYYYMLKTEETDGTKGVLANISNINYNADTDELKNAYTDLDLDFNVVLSAMADDIATFANDFVEQARNKGITDSYQLELVRQYAVDRAFNNWIYLANDDTGMFGNKTYNMTPDGTDSQYVAEYTILGREISKQSVGSYSINSIVDNSKVKTLAYNGETEMFKKLNGVNITTTSSNFVTTDSKGKETNTDIYTLTTADGNKISYILNDYGVQLIMLSNKNVDDSRGTITEDTNEDGDTVYILGADYKVTQEVKVVFVKDADDKNTTTIDTIKVEIKTLAEQQKQTLKEQKQNDILTNDQTELFETETNFTKNDKIYEAILKLFAN